MKRLSTIRLLVGIFISCVLILTLIIHGPKLEQEYLPVITETVAQDVYMDNDKIIVTGKFNKVRNCTLHTISAYLTDDQDDDKKERVNIEILDLGRTKPIPLPLGNYEFGPWVISPGHLVKTKESRLVVYTTHTCHAFYTSSSRLIEVDLAEVLQRK